MNRFNVVGTSGSGKSTFAKMLATKLGYRYIEMDAIFWGPNWYWPPDEEFFPKLEKALEGDNWVVDGNYTRTIPIKWRHPITVIWIDLPFTTTLLQATKRALKRAISQKEIWPNTNNRESIRKSFFSKDSIILWTIKTYHKVKENYEALMKDPQFSHVTFVRIRSHKEAEAYLNSL